MSEWEADSYFKQKAFDHIIANPLAAAFALCRNNAGAAAVPRQSSLQG